MPRKKNKLYRVINEQGEEVLTPIPGKYAGWDGGRPGRRIFGRFTCKSGMRMKKENRVFLSSWEAAIKWGRPCKLCKPTKD